MWECDILAIAQTDEDRLNDSYTALERKAALYNKLSSGQYDDDEEQYHVDFLSKGFLTDDVKTGNSSGRQPADITKPIDTYAMATQASGLCASFHCTASLRSDPESSATDFTAECDPA